MPVATTWSVVNMTRKTADGGVFEVNWLCKALNDSGPEIAKYGATYSCTPDPTSPDFTPYEDLTEDQVIGWVKDSLNATNPDAVTELEARLVTSVDEQIAINNADSTGVPWSTEQLPTD